MSQPKNLRQHSLHPSFINLMVLIAVTLASCTSTGTIKVLNYPSIMEDADYSKVLSGYLRKASIIKNFETRHIVSAIMLSPELVGKIEQRERMLLGNSDSSLVLDAKKNLSFFVSAYSLHPEENYLERNLLWGIKLKTKASETSYKPVSIRMIDQKGYTKAYFNSSDPWSRDYLISFAVDPKDLDSTDKSSSADLILSNKDGKITFSW